MVEELDGMLIRLRLGAIREQLDGLLEEAARRQLNLRETLAWLCAAEVASKEQRRLSMAMTIARFPLVRTLEGFEFEAQPSIDPGKIRDLATCRWVANGDNVVLLGPPGVGKRPTWRWPSAERRSPGATPCSSPRRWSYSVRW
jgi:DNA replication protein DnaC